MPDSYITKKALAASLKELMEEMPFEKITVGDICNKCAMNRKSFYYHFKDKYDLVNWIFDIEFITIEKNNDYEDSWGPVDKLCAYFYDNRDFYRKAMRIKGQNSFPEYFREVLTPVLEKRILTLLNTEENLEFYSTFYADAFICAIERWLSKKDCMKPDKFVELLKSCIYYVAEKVNDEKKDQK